MIKYSFLIPYIPERTRYLFKLVDSLRTMYRDRDDYELCIATSMSLSPCVAYNDAAEKATGDRFILTSPECIHLTNILAGLDNTSEDDYVVCACKTKNEAEWYQHSVKNNRMLNFCSCISRRNWYRIGGFLKEFSHGIAYDDDDFLARVKQNRLNIVCRDDLVVEHLEHDRIYQNNPELINKNKELYNYIWGDIYGRK